MTNTRRQSPFRESMTRRRATAVDAGVKPGKQA
jgi:hypothetical protein